jgi:hypothetical protein
MRQKCLNLICEKGVVAMIDLKIRFRGSPGKRDCGRREKRGRGRRPDKWRNRTIDRRNKIGKRPQRIISLEREEKRREEDKEKDNKC